MWSFVDYLLAQGDEAFQRFALRVRERPLRSRFCPPSLALAWHDEAFQSAFGGNRESLAARWRKSVLASRR
jgi:hypothetical protein